MGWGSLPVLGEGGSRMGWGGGGGGGGGGQPASFRGRGK